MGKIGAAFLELYEALCRSRGSVKDRFDRAYEETQQRSEVTTIYMSWPDCGPKG